MPNAAGAPRAFSGKCTRICPMRKLSSDIRASLAPPLMGFAIMILFVVCFLLAMVVLMCLTRLLLG